MKIREYLLIFFVLWLGACSSGEPFPELPSQQWQDITVRLESRPPRVAKGMNEFVAITTFGQFRPASDHIVSFRINNQGKWHQAIQDGHIGAFRKAVFVSSPTTDHLTVRIEKGKDVGVLDFPLQFTATQAQ